MFNSIFAAAALSVCCAGAALAARVEYEFTFWNGAKSAITQR